RFFLPFYEGARIRPWKWRVGLTVYDMLAGSGNLSRHRALRRHRLLEQSPGLSASGLLGGAEFFDAQMDDARLCIEVLHSAAEHGARIANHVAAVGFERRG